MKCTDYQEIGLAIDVLRSLEQQLHPLSSRQIGQLMHERMMFLASEKLKSVLSTGKRLI